MAYSSANINLFCSKKMSRYLNLNIYKAENKVGIFTVWHL